MAADHGDRIDRFVADLRRSMRVDDPPERATVARRRLARVVELCGWKRRSAARMVALSERLDDEGIYASVRLENLDLGLDTVVRFATMPFVDLGRVFRTERSLGYHLSRYPGVIEESVPGISGLKPLSGGKNRERSYPFDGHLHRPDLVFRAADGRYVVFELERTDPDRESVAQLSLYLRAVQAHVATDVVGVLVTARPRSRALASEVGRQLAALAEEYPVHWFAYDASVSLQPQPDA